MKSYLTRKFEMAVLHWKQGLICDKLACSQSMNRSKTYRHMSACAVCIGFHRSKDSALGEFYLRFFSFSISFLTFKGHLT